MMYEGRGWIGEEELPASWSLPAKRRESDGPYAGDEQCARENDSHPVNARFIVSERRYA
jgi:hypothetical protein